ncbi:decapping endonuclease targeting mRNA [Modicella reniformis]|uniref:Decapping nuclease n=1 Tax=Modicella reniformis TaxID=1440133 RepID=A0A9P6J275_9FUNG|nr:decapping endonuclease targeting mRNA [Modicella reniformis]
MVHPLHRFKSKCAPFQQPIEIGSFSYDEERNFRMDDSQLKYYFPPDLTKPNNLSVNYDKYISRDLMVDEHIDALLHALVCIRDREEEQQQQQSCESTPSSLQQKEGTEGDRKDVESIQSSTQLTTTGQLKQQPKKRMNAAGSDDRQKLMSYWGYRFETICNISNPVSELRKINTKKRRHRGQGYQDKDPSTGNNTNTHATDGDGSAQQSQGTDPKDNNNHGRNKDKEKNKENNRDNDNDGGSHEKDSDDYEVIEKIDLEDPELTGRLNGIVDTNLQYCTVARTKIGRNSVIMGAEVDCISEPKKPPPHNPLSKYIELKTSRVITNAREQNNFERHKLLKFWAQSFLPGIPTIIVGFRDDNGNVLSVETFNTMEIPRLVRGKEGTWDTTICINFLDGVFNFLRKIIVIDDPEATYTIRWDAPFKAIEVVYEGKKSKFLTERFLNRSDRDPDHDQSTSSKEN